MRFAYGTEEMPRVDWADQPKLETANWPEERRQRTFRAYALEYLRTMLPTLQELLGPADAQTELGRVARLVGLQFHEETARDMGLPTDVERGDLQARATSRAGCRRSCRPQGEEIETTERDGAVMVSQSGWRAVRELDARRSAEGLRCLERALARRRRGARPVPDGSDHPRRSDERGWSIAWRIAPR